MVIAITLILSTRLGRVEMREDEETFISANSLVLKQYREFQKTFESNEGVIVAFETPNLFSEKELTYLKHLQSKLESLPGVIEVNSLVNTDNIYGVDEGLEIHPVVDLTDLSEANLKAASEEVKGNPLYEGVYISKDQKVTAIIIELAGMFNGGADSTYTRFYENLTQLIQSEEKATGRRIYTGGDIVTDAAVEKLMDRDLSILFPLSLVLCASILIFFFGNWATTIIPLLPVLTAIVWVIGLKGWTGIPMTPISITLFPLIMVIGMANSIHIISHYKRLRPLEKNCRQALIRTHEAVLKPCFLAAFTTAIGFGSLAISEVTGIRQMGVFAAFGIMSAFILSMIVIPFALQHSKLFVNEGHNERKKLSLGPVLQIVDKLNHNNPWKIAIVFSVITLVMIAFIPGIKVEGSMASFARENTRLRQDIQFLDRTMSGINSFELVLTGGENCFKNPENLKKLDLIAGSLSNSPEVLKTFSPADLVKTINKALHADNPNYHKIPNSDSEVAQYLLLYEMSGGEDLSNFVNEDYSAARLTIRTGQMNGKAQKRFIDTLRNLTEQHFTGLSMEITGYGMLMNHINQSLVSTQVESIVMALGVILLLMFAMFGLKGGLLSILPNLFPIVFFLGLMGIFHIDLNMATSIIASVTIGIVVDDTIHFFFGYKKEMQQLNNPSTAISLTMQKVGAAMLITSLILTLGFGILMLSSSKFIGEFGIMSASAIATALLADLFISPIVLLKSRLFFKKNL
jgi:hypothetical protein